MVKIDGMWVVIIFLWAIALNTCNLDSKLDSIRNEIKKVKIVEAQ